MGDLSEYSDFTIPLENVHPDENQPRKQFSDEKIKELALSIETHGQIEPIVVTPDSDGSYMIIQGERRFKAITSLSKKYPTESKWKSIKATVIEEADSILSIISSIVRQELNTMEFAAALSELKKSCGEGTTNKKLANLVGKSETNISEWLSLNTLPQKIRDHAQANNIVSFRQLKQLAIKNMKDAEKESAYFALCDEHGKKKSTFAEMLHKKAKSVSTHLISTTRAIKLLDKKLTSENLQEEDKHNLIASLEAIIKQAQDMRDKLDDSKQE